MTAKANALSRGTKHACTNLECGKRFYDLNKLPTPCPYCGVLFSEIKVEAAPVGRRAGKYVAFKLEQTDVRDQASPSLVEAIDVATDDEAGEEGAAELLEMEVEDEETTLDAAVGIETEA